jgi:hypothetical protein
MRLLLHGLPPCRRDRARLMRTRARANGRRWRAAFPVNAAHFNQIQLFSILVKQAKYSSRYLLSFSSK